MDPLSFYQIAGIHGVPYIPWQETSVSTQDPTRGYCTHNSPLFATWHRPYLALFEQRLVKHAIFAASKFKGNQAARWQAAAREVRLPYWDWAASDLQSRQPPQLKNPTVTVTRAGANGAPQVTSIQNPLFEYRFQRSDLRTQYFRNQFANAPITRRQPPNRELTSTNVAAVDNAMFNGYSSRRNSVYNLFTIPTFREFSNTQRDVNNNPNGWNSVESIHNTIHVNAGGQYGHMTAVPYSAFDPIFWLHHANVDRLIAMYQAIHPDRKMEPQQASGTFHRRVTVGMRDDINTPLAPFRKPNGNYYTSNDVSSAASIWSLGYAYPEVPYSYQNRTASLPSFTTSRVNALYRPAGSTTKRNVEIQRREWICHMTFDAGEIAGSADVQIFFDPKANVAPSAGPTAVGTGTAASGTGFIPFPTKTPKFKNDTTSGIDSSAHFVGSAASFQDASMFGMKMDITGAVYMTDALLAAGCPSLEPSDVEPFLKKNLKWVIKLGGEQIIPLERVPSLKVGVSSAEAMYPANEETLAEFGEFTTHYSVTEDKKCGFTPDDAGLVHSRPEDEPTYGAPSATEEGPSYGSPTEASGEDSPVTSAPPASPTEVNTIHTTITVTVKATDCACPAVTTAYTSIYSSVAVPEYAVY